MTSRYLHRELRAARESEAVIIRIDTPGGLDVSMREITTDLLESQVPVVVYVAPRGARAASAGMFVTMAANVAAMAPGTNIGAAHPVAIGRPTGENAKDNVMEKKLTEDAAALARSIAHARRRNATWAEQAVTASVSITAQEALTNNVIDLIARDTSDLMRQLDRMRVVTAAGPKTLHTRLARIVERPMSFPERIMHVITDPNIAYTLMTIGIIGIIAALYNPGLLAPGIIGVTSLILAFVAFGSLPVSWAGVVLLIAGVGMLVIDLISEGFGFIGVAGIAAFILGSLMLYSPISPVSPTMPNVNVSLWLILTMSGLIASFLLIVGRAILKSRHRPVATGIETLTGKIGVALTDIAPAGQVRIDSETWQAETQNGSISSGRAIQVIGVSGVILKVILKTEDKENAA